jgi:hypothetical protein
LSRIPVDHKNSIYNVGAATHNYVVSVGAAQVKIAEGMNDSLERLERIENMLKGTAQRRP